MDGLEFVAAVRMLGNSNWSIQLTWSLRVGYSNSATNWSCSALLGHNRVAHQAPGVFVVVVGDGGAAAAAEIVFEDFGAAVGAVNGASLLNHHSLKGHYLMAKWIMTMVLFDCL